MAGTIPTEEVDKLRGKKGEVRSDKDLKRLKEEGAHFRHERLLGCINWLAIALIYLFVIAIIAWMGILGYHYIKTGDWTSFTNSGNLLAVAIISYLVSYLQSHGIKDK